MLGAGGGSSPRVAALSQTTNQQQQQYFNNRGQKATSSVRLRKNKERHNNVNNNRHSGDFSFFSRPNYSQYYVMEVEEEDQNGLGDWAFIKAPQQPRPQEQNRESVVNRNGAEPLASRTPVKVVTRQVPGIVMPGARQQQQMKQNNRKSVGDLNGYKGRQLSEAQQRRFYNFDPSRDGRSPSNSSRSSSSSARPQSSDRRSFPVRRSSRDEASPCSSSSRSSNNNRRKSEQHNQPLSLVSVTNSKRCSGEFSFVSSQAKEMFLRQQSVPPPPYAPPPPVEHPPPSLPVVKQTDFDDEEVQLRKPTRSKGLGRRAATQIQLDNSKAARRKNSYTEAIFHKSQDNLVKASNLSPPVITNSALLSSDDANSSLDKTVLRSSVFSAHAQTNNSSTVRKGLLWSQRDRLFSRWKERYFVLTKEYLNCFKRGTSRISEMGDFMFKPKMENHTVYEDDYYDYLFNATEVSEDIFYGNSTSSGDVVSYNVTEASVGNGGAAESKYFVNPWPPNNASLAVCYNFVLKSDLQELMAWKFWLSGVVSSLLCLFGFFGNVFAAVVLSSPKMSSAFNQLLVALCVFDTFFLVCNVPFCLNTLGIGANWFVLFAKRCSVVSNFPMVASVLMIVALTSERHFAICSPHKYRIHLRTVPRWRHLFMYIAPVVVSALVLNIPLFINLIQENLLKNALYVRINLYLRALHPFTTTGLLPSAVLIVLNLRICRGIQVLHQRRTKRNRRELNMAYIAIVIVSLFVISNVPRILAGAIEVSNTSIIIFCVEQNTRYIHGLLFYKVDFIARTLMVFNSSINFLVYCAVSPAFKKAFYHLLTPSCQRFCLSLNRVCCACAKDRRRRNSDGSDELNDENTLRTTGGANGGNNANGANNARGNNSSNGQAICVVLDEEFFSEDEATTANLGSGRRPLMEAGLGAVVNTTALICNNVHTEESKSKVTFQEEHHDDVEIEEVQASGGDVEMARTDSGCCVVMTSTEESEENKNNAEEEAGKSVDRDQEKSNN